MFSKKKSVEKVEQITDNKHHLKKESIKFVNSAIGVLGPPGAGKSTLCCAYYKIKYNMENNYFEISSSPLSFTKGIWILKEEERMKIKGNIDRDILDCEGFQIDKIETWKYVMIISFICSDIIILNGNKRFDDIKKVLNIIKNSLEKMRQSNIPKLLKNIYIHYSSKKKLRNFEQDLASLGYKEDSLENIKISAIYIPTISETTIEDNDDNILNVHDYLNEVRKTFDNIPTTNVQSISTFIKYIDNLNMTLDGKMSFDTQGIIRDLRDEYNICYETWYDKKKKNLLEIELSEVETINETFDEFIEKQNLDFSFEENLEDLTFYGSSQEFDDIYRGFKKDYSFKIDKDIFLNKFEIKKKDLEIEILKKGTEREKKLSEFENYLQKQKRKIDSYFFTVKFYDYIDDKELHCNINITIDNSEDRNRLLNELYKYYEKQTKEIKKSWESQIKRAKYKSVCQTQGELKCANGHKLNSDPIKCCECDGTLYWVDGETHYCICSSCNKVSKCDSCVCSRCKARTLCIPKFTNFRP